MPDAFVGKLPFPGLLLQFGQVVSGGIGLGMGDCRKKGEPEKQASYKTSRPHVGTMGVMGIAIWDDMETDTGFRPYPFIIFLV
jgi:hypothetical protein